MTALGTATAATPPTPTAVTGYAPVISTVWGAVVPTAGVIWPLSS